ncbi:hypothetical protein AB1L30_19640 [Bremerella sp. JC817]|uniref:hypothetical protein n=1 Tax=Bremerella sp. JC817 TaxID=3231756 RepID=UPI00345995C1
MNQPDDSSNPTLLVNKHLSPLASAAVASVLAFGYLIYKSGDVVRALLVSAMVFPIMAFILWKAQSLSEKSRAQPKHVKTSRGADPSASEETSA